MNKLKMAIVTSMVLGATLVPAVRAGLYVDWGFSWGMTTDGTTPVANSTAVMWQLIYSPDATIGIVDPSNGANGYVSGNDVVLQTRTTPAGGDGVVYDNYLYASFGSPTPYGNTGTFDYVNGILYIRVFQDTTPTAGDLYYNGPAVTPQNLNPLAVPTPIPQFIEGNFDTANGNQLNLVVVPEPATIAFAVVGVALIAIRRKLRN